MGSDDVADGEVSAWARCQAGVAAWAVGDGKAWCSRSLGGVCGAASDAEKRADRGKEKLAWLDRFSVQKIHFTVSTRSGPGVVRRLDGHAKPGSQNIPRDVVVAGRDCRKDSYTNSPMCLLHASVVCMRACNKGK